MRAGGDETDAPPRCPACECLAEIPKSFSVKPFDDHTTSQMLLSTTSRRRHYARNGYVLDKRRRNGGIRAVSARARTFSKLFPVLRIGIAFDAFKYYVRREPGLVCMVPDDRLKILFRMLSLFKAFIDPNIGVGLHHSF